MKSRQQALPFRTHGGKRPGAGRKPRGAKAGVSHRARRDFAARHPLHVTMKVVPDLPNLRRRHLWRAVQWALAITVRRPDFRVCHVSVQGNHLHLIVEAEGRAALARGMQGFAISCAKQINARVFPRGTRPRKGRVFYNRYHATVLDGPRRVRHALAYVLNNWRKHRIDSGSSRRLDPFSTAHQFPGWAERQAEVQLLPRDLELLPVAYPTTWLLTTGWKRGGGLLSVAAVPGPAAR